MPEQIEQYMRTLKLGGMAREWRGVEFQSKEQYVRELLELELREREANRINRMVKTAGFQVIKTLDDFVWNQGIELPVGLTREYMEGLQFLKPRENLIFLGSVGTGKTHLATAIALAACQAGRRVRFFTAASLANLRRIHSVVEYRKDMPPVERGAGVEYLFPTVPRWVKEAERLTGEAGMTAGTPF